MRKTIAALAGFALILNSCVNDNEQEMFPHVVIPDSTIKGQIASFSFDSGLFDDLGKVDPLRFWGSEEFGTDHHMTDSAAVVLDGIRDYLSGYLGRHDSLAISMWFLAMPNYRQAYLVDYGIGQFAAGLDAITSATFPAFSIFMKQDTTTFVWAQDVDYFFWHHLYMEIGDTGNPPRLFVDANLLGLADTIWSLHPLTDMFYLGRPFNADIMDTLLYRGYLDEIKIFNTFLTEDEIINLYWGGVFNH
ncbi:MAG: hypothetical protein V2A67_04235 [Bacteroidota bacterium]